jgi:hypothetical protein
MGSEVMATKKRNKQRVPLDQKVARIRQSKQAKWLSANDAPMNSKINAGRLEARFAPILKAFQDMEETGESLVNQNNEVVYMPAQHEGVYYPLAPSLLLSCKTFDIVCRHRGVPLVSEGMRHAAKKLEAGVELCQSDLDAARKSIADVIEVMMPLTPREIESCIQAQEIQELMENAA